MTTITIYKTEIRDHREPVRYGFHLSEIDNSDMFQLPRSGAEEIEVMLPAGYNIGQSKAGDVMIFDDEGNGCELDAVGQTPRLVSLKGEVLLKTV